MLLALRPISGCTNTTVCWPGGTVALFGVLPRGRPSKITFDGGVELKVRVAFAPPLAGAGAGAAAAAAAVDVRDDAAKEDAVDDCDEEDDERSATSPDDALPLPLPVPISITNVFSAWPSS